MFPSKDIVSLTHIRRTYMSKTYWFVEPFSILSLKLNGLEKKQSLG